LLQAGGKPYLVTSEGNLGGRFPSDFSLTARKEKTMITEILEVGQEALPVKDQRLILIKNLEDAKQKTEGVTRDDCIFIKTSSRELTEMIVCHLCLRGMKNIIYG
jgi:hypothetical protein